MPASCSGVCPQCQRWLACALLPLLLLLLLLSMAPQRKERGWLTWRPQALAWTLFSSLPRCTMPWAQ